jgi:hypothetical protein
VESERAASGRQELLRAERVVRRPLPLNVRDDEIGLFSGELERVIPPATLQELREVRISADGLLFKGLRLLPDSFAFPTLKDDLPVRARAKLLAINFALRRHRTFEKRAVWITDTWSVGYFHWLTDALSRLYMIRERAAESVLILPQPFRSLEYAHASLEAFNLSAIEFIGRDEVLLCRRLLLPGHAAYSGHFDEEVIRGVRTLLIGRFGTPPPPPGAARIYVSRALARKRRIANEAAVIDALRAREFRIVYSERLTLRDQVRLCSWADVLVSNHGAGLTNMLFMPDGAKVLELRHHGDAVGNCYFTLAAALGLHYFFQGCVPVDPIANPHQADLLVDVDRLNSNLDLMLRR